MKRIALPVLAIVLFSSAALASDDPFANYYANTLVVTDDSGSTSVYVQPDGTFHETLPDGTKVSGTWKIADGKGCFYVEGAPPHCVPAQKHDVGDEWQVPAVNGPAEQVTLLAGR